MFGKDRGKTGKVMKIDYSNNTVLVENLNLYKKHQRPRRQGEKGEIVNLPRPMNVSKIASVCSSCGKPTRVGYRFEGENKSRYCKKCKNTF